MITAIQMLTSILQGSNGKLDFTNKPDGFIEDYGDFAQKVRSEINYYNLNGTDVPSIINAVVSGVIGSGINIQSTYQDKAIQTQFEDLLEEHSEVGNFTTCGRFSRDEALRKIVGYETLQGGVLVRHHYNPKWNIPYRLELIPVTMIDTAQTDYTYKNGLKAQNGLVKDKYNRIVGIYLYTNYDRTKSKVYSTKDLAFYSTNWIDLSQYTAVSRLVSIIPQLTDTMDYLKAEVKSAKKKADAGAYWTTELYDILIKMLKDELKSLGNTKAQKTEIKEIINLLAQRGSMPDGLTPLPRDDKVYQIEHKADSVYKTVADNTEKKIASAVGGSSVSIYKDIEKGNYSSIKAGISFDEEHYKMEFAKLTDHIIRPYLQRLFMIGVQTKKIAIDKKTFFDNPRQFYKFDILRQSKRVIDEKKEADSIAKHLANGSTTLKRVYAENGLDYLTEKEKQIRLDIEVELLEQKLRKDAGLSPKKEENV